MATYLRDEQLQNLTITSDRLRQIDAAFQSRFRAVPEFARQEGNNKAFLFYVIRFDNKGYRVFSIEDLISYFQQADHVERVIFAIESGASIQSNRNVGTYMELRLDAGDKNLCHLVASADIADWVDASFSAIRETLEKCKNRHSIVRNDWSALSIQIGGVLVGFLVSIWAAVLISPFIDIDNSFFITFLFVLLVFSNIWGYINQRLLKLVDKVFPNVRFYRPDRDRLHWLMQALIGGIAVAVTLFLLNKLFIYLGKVIGQFFGSGP